MAHYFKNLFNSKKNNNSNSNPDMNKLNNAAIFSFTSFKILKERCDPTFYVNDLSSNSIIETLRKHNNQTMVKFYEEIKDDFEKEFENINKFDAVCFHSSTNIIVTLTTVPYDTIRDNAVVCVKYSTNYKD